MDVKRFLAELEQQAASGLASTETEPWDPACPLGTYHVLAPALDEQERRYLDASEGSDEPWREGRERALQILAKALHDEPFAPLIGAYVDTAPGLSWTWTMSTMVLGAAACIWMADDDWVGEMQPFPWMGLWLVGAEPSPGNRIAMEAFLRDFATRYGTRYLDPTNITVENHRPDLLSREAVRDALWTSLEHSEVLLEGPTPWHDLKEYRLRPIIESQQRTFSPDLTGGERQELMEVFLDHFYIEFRPETFQ